MSPLALSLSEAPLNCAVYRPNLRTKSDADILRDAKLEAMGMPAQDNSPPRRTGERTQKATDEIVGLFLLIYYWNLGVFITLQVMERFKKRMRK